MHIIICIALYLLAVFAPLPVFLTGVACYAMFYDDQYPLAIALLIDVQFSTFTAAAPWYVLGTAAALTLMYLTQPYLRFARQP